MIQVRLVPRILVLLGVPLVIAACASRPYSPDSGSSVQPLRGGVCSSGDPNPNAPIVCVTDGAGGLSISPDPVRPDDVQGGRPITIVWRTSTGTGDLHIDMKSPDCVRNVNCNGNGQCTAQTIRGSTATCKYDVWITGGGRLDPTVVIQPCCGA